MIISASLWTQVLMLESEFNRRGNRLSRYILKETFKIPDNTARFLKNALDNKDVIRVKPTEIEVSKSKELVMADLHIPYQDKAAIEIVLDYAKKEKIDRTTLLGDIVDCYKVSVFVKNPTKKSVKEEITECHKFLVELRNMFPDIEIVYYKGNHEERIDKYIMSKSEELYDLLENLLPQKLELEKLNIDFKTEVFRIGKLWHLHGHEKPKGPSNAEYITNVMWKYIHDHYICGHWHRSQDKIFPHITKEKKYHGSVIGWLALAEAADYMKLNNWNQGFAIVDYDHSGNFSISNKTILNGDIY